MITVAEAARRVMRNPATVWRWIREGRLASQRIGKEHFVDERELDFVVARPALPVPAAWKRTATGEPMPAILNALDWSRSAR